MPRIIGRTVLHFDQVTSTNDLARQQAEGGANEGLVISAELQTAGRGRMGRRWVAPPRTSLQLSVLLRPAFAAAKASSIVQMAALAAASTLRELVDSSGVPPLPNVAVKWPNDVLLNGKKCTGILLESGIDGEKLAFAILGIGINVNYSMSDFPELAVIATTLADELGHSIDRNMLQEALLKELDDYYAVLCAGNSGPSIIFEEWRSQLVTLGHPVRISTPSGIEEGVAVDVEADGALLLQRREDLIRLYSGDVSIIQRSDQRRLE